MLDIIIPVYKAKETIKRLLYSIAIQKDINKFNVYLCVDNPLEDYQVEVDFFSKYYNIKQLKLDKNSGPGLARQYGINNSNGKYIVFMDADDYLYSPLSLYYLYNEIDSKNLDFVIGNFIYERDNEIKIMKKNNVWLHGKIYRRSFLKDNDIHFNDTRANEDNGFNRLLIFHEPKIGYLDKIIYIYSENSDSITRKNNRLYKFTGLEWFTYNIKWAIDIALEKKLNLESICLCSLGVLSSMYYYYLDLYNDYDVSKLLLWSKGIKEVYDKYKDNYVTEEIYNFIMKSNKDNYNNIIEFITFDEFLNRIDGEEDD